MICSQVWSFVCVRRKVLWFPLPFLSLHRAQSSLGGSAFLLKQPSNQAKIILDIEKTEISQCDVLKQPSNQAKEILEIEEIGISQCDVDSLRGLCGNWHIPLRVSVTM